MTQIDMLQHKSLSLLLRHFSPSLQTSPLNHIVYTQALQHLSLYQHTLEKLDIYKYCLFPPVLTSQIVR